MPIRLMKPSSLERKPGQSWLELFETLRYPLLCSSKLDGLRCATPGGIPQTNSGKPFPNKLLQEALRKYPDLDGELIKGHPWVSDSDGGIFHRTQSVVMSQDEVPDRIGLWVFDYMPLSNLTYANRLLALQEFVFRGKKEITESPYLQLFLLNQEYITTPGELELFLIENLNSGAEGIILRNPFAPYKFNRSTLREGGMLRIKPREDTEARIVGWKPLSINMNEDVRSELGYAKRSSAKAGKYQTESVGSLILEDPRWNKPFGVTVADPYWREALWANRDHLAGKLAKFSYMPYGTKDAPRQPSFLCLRNPEDLTP